METSSTNSQEQENVLDYNLEIIKIYIIRKEAADLLNKSKNGGKITFINSPYGGGVWLGAARQFTSIK